MHEHEAAWQAARIDVRALNGLHTLRAFGSKHHAAPVAPGLGIPRLPQLHVQLLQRGLVALAQGAVAGGYDLTGPANAKVGHSGGGAHDCTQRKSVQGLRLSKLLVVCHTKSGALSKHVPSMRACMHACTAATPVWNRNSTSRGGSLASLPVKGVRTALRQQQQEHA